MAKSLIAILFLQIFFTICLSEEIVSEEDGCIIELDEDDKAAMKSMNFIAGKSNRWPNGTVPYIIHRVVSATDRQVIQNAIQNITERTCIKFVERTNQFNYVYIFTRTEKCIANLGYNSQRSIHGLNLESPVHLGTAVQGLLLILGFAYEHTRPDRDEYVKINWANIDGYSHDLFWRTLRENETTAIPNCGKVGIDKYDNCYAGFKASTFGMAYDYGSVMHLGLKAFTWNGNNTIILKKETSVRPPNKSGMSNLDVKKIKAAYECPDSSTTPAPSTKVPECTISTAKPCVDKFRRCRQYKFFCGRHWYINKYCKKTCFNCVCKNNFGDESCSKLTNFCRKRFIRKNCKKSCKKC